MTVTAPVLQSDISPDEGQMLDWIVTAAKSNKFSVVHDKGMNGLFECHQHDQCLYTQCG